VTGLPPGEGVVLLVRREGAVPKLIEGLSLVPGVRSEGLWIELDPGGAVTGTVADRCARRGQGGAAGPRRGARGCLDR
jgi:hypothetical protein